MESPTSTIPPSRQNDVPGQYSSLIIPQKGALSGLAERTRLFFFFFHFKMVMVIMPDYFLKFLLFPSHFPMQVPLNYQVQLKKKKKEVPFKSILLFVRAVTKSLRLQDSVVPFYVVFNWYKQSRIVPFRRRHRQLRIASESHSSSGRFIPLPPVVPCFIHRRCSLSSSFSES